MDTSVLDLLDKEAAKLPLVSKKTHDAEFAMMVAKANRSRDPNKAKPGPKRDSGGRLHSSEHERRLNAYHKHKGNFFDAAASLGLNVPTYRGWYQRYGKHMEENT